MYLLCYISTIVLFYFYEILFFQQLVSKPKVTRRKGGFLVRVGAVAEDGKFKVKKFNGQNYQLWKLQMEDYLYHKDLYLPLGGIEKKLTAMKDKE
jgi:hypothetical protein